MSINQLKLQGAWEISCYRAVSLLHPWHQQLIMETVTGVKVLTDKPWSTRKPAYKAVPVKALKSANPFMFSFQAFTGWDLSLSAWCLGYCLDKRGILVLISGRGEKMFLSTKALTLALETTHFPVQLVTSTRGKAFGSRIFPPACNECRD